MNASLRDHNLTDRKREVNTSDLIDRLRWLNKNAFSSALVWEIEVIEHVLRERGIKSLMP